MEATKQGSIDAAKEARFSQRFLSVDKIASKGVIHKNKAARKKSRLAKKVNTLSVGSFNILSSQLFRDLESELAKGWNAFPKLVPSFDKGLSSVLQPNPSFNQLDLSGLEQLPYRPFKRAFTQV